MCVMLIHHPGIGVAEGPTDDDQRRAPAVYLGLECIVVILGHRISSR